MPDPNSVDLGHAMTLPPEQAVAYFRSKGFTINWNWWETWQEAHDRAFTVARMTRFDLLAQTRQIVGRTLAQGRTLRQGAQELETALRKAGWWGKQTIVDEQGRAQRVQLGSAHRIRTILRTNIDTAFAAGRYQRQAETAKARPFWQYLAVRDKSTRASHRALHGRVFPADDPIWSSIYPPNGFRCRCRVRSLSRRQVQARGLKVVEKTSAREIRQEAGLDKRTGEIIERPGTRVSWSEGNKRRAFTPDPGWSYNPGRAAFTRPVDSAARAVSGQPDWKQYGLPHARDLSPTQEPPELPAGKTPAQAARTVQATLGLSGKRPRRRVRTPVEEVLLDRDKIAHVTAKFDQHRERYANRILPTLADPDEVWMTYYSDGTFRKRYLKVFQGKEGKQRGSLSVVAETPDGQILYNFIPLDPSGVNRNRAGALLHRKEE